MRERPIRFPTPYTLTEGTLTAGVEVQATILDNLRHSLYVLPGATPGHGAARDRRSIPRRRVLHARRHLADRIVGSLSSSPSSSSGPGLLLRFGRVWAPPALPAAAALAVFGSRFGLDYARERHLRRTVSEAFSRYLSPDLVAQLARDPSALKLGGERRNLSILFCDVRGFTTLSEKLKDEPERLTTLINRLLDPLSEAVLAEGGTIDKYIGDCVMAFWNAPLPSPDHPLRAARAAMRMLEAVEILNAELRQEQGEDAPVFAIGVGINTGDCVVGNVGSRWRYDYSVLGDTVNLASRLESLSKEYGVSIVLGPATAKALQDHFVLIELDRIAVKGRSEKSAIFTIVAPAGQSQDPALAELMELHPTLLDSIAAGKARGSPGARSALPDAGAVPVELLRQGPGQGGCDPRVMRSPTGRGAYGDRTRARDSAAHLTLVRNLRPHRDFANELQVKTISCACRNSLYKVASFLPPSPHCRIAPWTRFKNLPSAAYSSEPSFSS